MTRLSPSPVYTDMVRLFIVTLKFDHRGGVCVCGRCRRALGVHGVWPVRGVWAVAVEACAMPVNLGSAPSPTFHIFSTSTFFDFSLNLRC